MNYTRVGLGGWFTEIRVGAEKRKMPRRGIICRPEEGSGLLYEWLRPTDAPALSVVDADLRESFLDLRVFDPFTNGLDAHRFTDRQMESIWMAYH